MTTPEQLPASEDPLPLSDRDLIDIAAADTGDKSADFLASFTSFLNIGLPHDKALEMLGIKPDEARKKLVEIRQKQSEAIKQNAEAVWVLGRRATSAVIALNPLRYFDKK